MTTVGDAAQSRGDIMRRLSDLERRLREMQAARRLENASVGAGGIRIYGGGNIQIADGGAVVVSDTDGPVVRLGRLTGNEFQPYGLEQKLPSGSWVPIAALAAGAQSAVVDTEQSLSRSAGQDTGFTDLATVGPRISVTTYTGKLLIMLFAEVETTGGRTAARMGYAIGGEQATNARSSLVNWPDSGGRASAAYVNVHNAEPGSTLTITAKYRLIAPSSMQGTALWSNRALVVLPY